MNVMLSAACVLIGIGLIVVFMRGAKDRRAIVSPTIVEHKREAWKPDVHRFPSMKEPAAKGFKRDVVIGRDQITRVERMRMH